jgi:hypothetical protein
MWVGVAKGEFGARDGDAAHGHLFLPGLDAVLSTRASLKSSSAADCWPDLVHMHGDFLYTKRPPRDKRQGHTAARRFPGAGRAGLRSGTTKY